MSVIPKKPKSDGKQDSSLAVAYDMKKRNRKKMSDSGYLASAAQEKRAMPDQPQMKKYAQGGEVMKPKMQSMKAPRMMESAIIKPRLRSDMDEELMRQHEEHLMKSMSPENFADGGSIPEITEIPATNEDKAKKAEKANYPVAAKYLRTQTISPYSNESYDSEADKYTQHNQMGSGKTPFADGGMIDDMDQPMDEADEEHQDSIAAAIMARRDRKMMAEGGMVDIDMNAEEQPNEYYDQNEAILKENYDSDMDDVSQPLDSNEHGDDISSDKHDRITAIRSRMIKQRIAGK